MIRFKALIFERVTLKVIALLLGITVWTILSNYQVNTQWVDAPVCFYNTQENQLITAPESVKVALSGKRSLFLKQSAKDIGIYLDAQAFKAGTHAIAVHQDMLHAGPGFSIVDYHPHTLIIKVA